jgi:hypothetical protein
MSMASRVRHAGRGRPSLLFLNLPTLRHLFQRQGISIDFNFGHGQGEH